jgi:uncharacterized membrane protein
VNTQPGRALRSRRLATRSSQRGATALFSALVMFAMVASMLMALNIGRLYYAQRDLQKMASLAAIAGVEISSGCRNGGVPGNTAAVTTLVKSALAANGGTVAMLTGFDGAGAVQLGRIDDTTGIHTFVPLTDGDPRIDAVRVNLTNGAPSMIGSGFFPGTGALTLRASATAQQQPLGAFSIGSTLVSLNTSQSILNPLLSGLLGTSLSLSAVDYNGLAQTQLSLANLMVAANVNDLNSLLAINTTAAGLQTLLAAATNQVNPGVANLITGLTLGSTQATTSISLASILGNVGNGLNPLVTDAAAQVPFVNVLDMLAALGYAAAASNGETITLPVSVNVPGLASLYVYLQVLQPMQPSGFGPVGTTQNTAQIVLKLRANVDPTSFLGLLSLLANATINLAVDINVAQATGTISALSCPSGTSVPPSGSVALTTGLVSLKLGTFTGAASSAPAISTTAAPLLNVTVLGIPVITLTVNAPVSVPLGTGSGTAGPFTLYNTPTALTNTTDSYVYEACNSLSINPCAVADSTNPQTPVSSDDIATGLTTGIGNLVGNLTPSVLGIGMPGLTSILGALTTTLLTPVATLVDSILNPLLAALGVQVGSGTVLWQGFETGQPVIVSYAQP